MGVPICSWMSLVGVPICSWMSLVGVPICSWMSLWEFISVVGPPGISGSIISVGDYVDNSFTALGSSDPREVRLELQLGFYVFHFQFVHVHFVFC